MRGNRIYYLPGRNGELNAGLGMAIQQRGYQVEGREITSDFAGISFQEQINVIKVDLRDGYWESGSEVVAVSYGAYLLMHALSEMKSFPGKILLLSPILGGATDEKHYASFQPPRADRLMKRVYAGKFCKPESLEVHVGDGDWQSNPVRVAQLGEKIGADVFFASDTGHQLGSNYVSCVLDQWLGSSEPLKLSA